MFPSSLQYIETISNPEGLFNTLVGLEVVTDGEDQPVFCSGNFGIVFKVNTRFGTKAVKCFTRHQAGRLFAYKRIAEAIEPSKYIIEYEYLEDEIYVFDDIGGGRFYPVLLMEWVYGETLTKHIERASYQRDTQRLSELAEKFSKLSKWLLSQTFAHNDLKPDNIMIRSSNDEMVMVDYDGMFVESMAGEASREFGTEPFQSPDRAKAPFDRNVDNYSISYINFALQKLVNNPELYSATSIVEIDNDEKHAIENTNDSIDISPQFVGNSTQGIKIYKTDEGYGFLHSTGSQLTDAVFERVMDFAEDGLAAVCMNNHWGYIDRLGNLSIPNVYDDCTSFSEGMAAVKIGNKWGFINTEGRSVSRFVYDNAWSPRFGMAMVCRKEKYGFVGSDGKIAISLRYDFVQNFTLEGLACVKVNDKYGYINRKGKWWAQPIYDYAQNFRDNRAAVELNGREFFISFDKSKL